MRAIAALDRLYARIPTIPDCQGRCHTSCGTILMTGVELARIEKRVRRPVVAAPLGADCSLLRGNRCSVYQLRPMVCRLWGVLEGMECPYGCHPERVLSYEEGMLLMAEADAISKGEDVVAVVEAVRRTLEENPGRVKLSRGLLAKPKVEG